MSHWWNHRLIVDIYMKSSHHPRSTHFWTQRACARAASCQLQFLGLEMARGSSSHCKCSAEIVETDAIQKHYETLIYVVQMNNWKQSVFSPVFSKFSLQPGIAAALCAHFWCQNHSSNPAHTRQSSDTADTWDLRVAMVANLKYPLGPSGNQRQWTVPLWIAIQMGKLSRFFCLHSLLFQGYHARKCKPFPLVLNK